MIGRPLSIIASTPNRTVGFRRAVTTRVRNDAGVAGRSRVQGLTLIELMIAMAIALAILAVMTQIFVTSQITYTHEEGLARVQESGRFAMDTLSYDIRMAGYSGCANLQSSDVNNNVAGQTLVNTYDMVGIEGYRYTGGAGIGGGNLTDWTPALPADYFNNGDVLRGSDVIILKFATSNGATLTGNTAPTNANVQILDENQGAFNAGDLLMVTDCKHADIFIANNVSNPNASKITITHGPPDNDDTTLKYSYNNGAEVMRFFSRAYYIGQGASGQPALFRNSGVGTAEELVEGVENMQIYYGVLPAGVAKHLATSVPERYYTANTVPSNDWSAVASVRVGVIVRTLSEVSKPSDQTVYDVLNDDLAGADDYDPSTYSGGADDQRQRHAFSFTVKKRKPLKDRT
jgi:type IV pilus assembly protein PilW